MRDKKVTKVTYIPAICNQTERAITKNIRVAAYARVSTSSETQETSLQAQRVYYEKYIREHEGWDFIDVYYDDGISGLSYRRRDGFNNMVNDALCGKIDLIITKSLSRFARNTVDTLVTIRNLKSAGVEVYFEKEDIYTFDAKGEFLITLMSSLAQEESRNLSENITWGIRKYFADGKYFVAYSHFLGYEKGLKNEMVINIEEARVVKLIYRLFLNGFTLVRICDFLSNHNLPTPTKQEVWYCTTIKSILTNVKYKGDALLQKEFTTDFLTKKRKKNEGEVPQYYVNHGHSPIVSYEVFDMVQRELEYREKINCGYSCVATYSTLLNCKCGSYYGHRTMHPNTKYESDFWVCSNFYKGGEHSRKVRDIPLRVATSIVVDDIFEEYAEEILSMLTNNIILLFTDKKDVSNIIKKVIKNQKWCDELLIRGILRNIKIDDRSKLSFEFINNKVLDTEYKFLRMNSK